jgi:hypothetical protein
MSTRKGRRWITGPALVVGAVVALASGCTITPGSGDQLCDAGLKAKAEALQGAVDDLVTVSADLKAQLAVACANMAKDLGATPPEVGDGTSVSDDDLKTACDVASMAITAKIKSTGTITPVVEGGQCQIAAQAQFDCEAKCDVSGKCTPGTIEARCDPGDISGECDGECMASATCEGSATVAASCQGTCDATCEGKCAGVCNGTCDGNASTGACAGTCKGECTASCTGSCTGNCKLDADAHIMCGAMATCRGGCSVMYKAPTCEGQLKPPSCDIDADCEAGCRGQASLEATCTPPTVDILISMDDTLKTTLEKNLPAVFRVATQGKLIAQAAQDVASAAQNVGTAVVDSAGCALLFGVDFATKLQASVDASVSLSVTVMASVSVTTSLGG